MARNSIIFYGKQKVEKLFNVFNNTYKQLFRHDFQSPKKPTHSSLTLDPPLAVFMEGLRVLQPSTPYPKCLWKKWLVRPTVLDHATAFVEKKTLDWRKVRIWRNPNYSVGWGGGVTDLEMKISDGLIRHFQTTTVYCLTCVYYLRRICIYLKVYNQLIIIFSKVNYAK